MQNVRAAAGYRRSTLRKEARGDLRRTEIIDRAKAKRHQFGAKFVGVEVALDGFAKCRHPRDQRLMLGIARRTHRRHRIDVVEHDLGAARQSRDEIERRTDRLGGQIRHDAEPDEEAALPRIEARGGEGIGQRLVLEIDRNETERVRYLDPMPCAGIGASTPASTDDRPRTPACCPPPAYGRPWYRDPRRAR